ncbi:MAG: DinB family protein [Melioribacteraceae bacterium]|nr:DinB family protein [Melioribacteraceae bacterium]
MNKISKPLPDEYPDWYAGYIASVPENNIVELLEKQLKEAAKVFDKFDEQKSHFRYAEGKWSVKEVMGHINDAERILSCRVLRFMRNDKTDVRQYDHDAYVDAGNFDAIPVDDLKKEFRFLRKATIMLFKNMNEEKWCSEGYSNGKKFTVRAMAYIIAGHLEHHLWVLKEKYIVG